MDLTTAKEPTDVPAAPSQYNFTIRFDSLLSLPSRILARIRKLDDQSTWSMTAAHAHKAKGYSSTADRHSADGLPYDLVPMPGPLAFITSGYAIGLVAMVSVQSIE